MNNLAAPATARSVTLLADPARSDTLPGWVYTDPATLATEAERVFFRTWQYAGAAQALVKPGDYITTRVLGQSVLVMRGRDGTIRGFYNVCQHRAHELLEGCGNSRVVTCPYHAWSYADDGSLRSARGAERQPGFEPARFCLKPVRVEVFAGKFVFYNLDPDAAPMRELAPDLAAELRVEIPQFDALVPADTATARPMAANWKVVLDNFHECFHCGPAHPAFSDMLDMANYRTTIHGLWSKQAGHLARLDNKAYPVAADANHAARFWWLWPNTTFGMMPGAPSFSVSTTLPDGVGRSVRHFQRFMLPGATPDPIALDYGRNILGPEDVAICESVQRGLASRGYTAGRFVHDPAGGQTTEAAVHHFHRLYAEAMGFTS